MNPLHPAPTESVADPLAFHMARSDGGVVVWESVAGWTRVVLMGPAASSPSLSERFLQRAKGAILEELHAAVPGADPVAECERLLQQVDRMLRQRLPVESEERATMVVAVARQGQVWVGHTGDGAVGLQRGEQLTWMLRSLPDSADGHARRDGKRRRRLLVEECQKEVPWIGVRADASTVPLMVRVRPRAIALNPGDRLLLASVMSAEMDRFGALSTLLREPRLDDAAHEIGSALAVRHATPELAVALLDWDRPAPDALPLDPIEGDLGVDFAGQLADLIREITDEYDAGATPTYSDRVTSADEATLAEEDPAEADAEADAEAVYDVPSRPATKTPYAPSLSRSSVPSQPTFDDHHLAAARRPHRPAAPSPPQRGRSIAIGVAAFGLTLLTLSLLLAFA